MAEFRELVGKTLIKIEGIDEQYADDLRFVCSDGSVYRMYHRRDCCESVQVEEVIGDIADLIGTPIIVAEEVIYDNEAPPWTEMPKYAEDIRWTFYKIRTIKGDVTIRWLGESNGYYSIYVSFYQEN